MTSPKTVTVYCGSSSHLAPQFIEAATALGRELAARGAIVVTGAGHTGLMGAIADATLAAGGIVEGIIPQFMVDLGWQHTGLSKLSITPDMHRRKELMAQSHACIALPGGIGTFEELCEIITWRQLGLFKGNVVIYNVADYYDPLLSMFAKAIQEAFMQPDHSTLYCVASTAAEAADLALAPTSQTEYSPKF